MDGHPTGSDRRFALPGEPPVLFDAVVLAGGAGRRMGGVSKADLQVGGRRLLDRVLAATAGARRTVVVGRVQVPAGVLVTMEDPPGQGPAAGLAAGLAALAEPRLDEPTRDESTGGESTGGGSGVEAPARDESTEPDEPSECDKPVEWVLVLACDLPGAERATGPLLAAASGAADRTDGVCLIDDAGHAQWLAAAYRRPRLAAALAAMGPLNGAPLKAVAARLTLESVAGLPAQAWTDVDTWEGLRGWDRLDEEAGRRGE